MKTIDQYTKEEILRVIGVNDELRADDVEKASFNANYNDEEYGVHPGEILIRPYRSDPADRNFIGVEYLQKEIGYVGYDYYRRYFVYRIPRLEEIKLLIHKLTS